MNRADHDKLIDDTLRMIREALQSKDPARIDHLAGLLAPVIAHWKIAGTFDSNEEVELG